MVLWSGARTNAIGEPDEDGVTESRRQTTGREGRGELVWGPVRVGFLRGGPEAPSGTIGYTD